MLTTPPTSTLPNAEVPFAPLPHSYRPDQVTFLLAPFTGDLLDVLEKESRLRSGAYYGDLLSRETCPDPAYTAIFDRLLARTAPSLAPLFLHLAERIHAERRGPITLVSLARAGTPVGVVLTEVLRQRFGREVEHYSVSAIHKYGVDPFALNHIRTRHDDASLVFLDGWVSQGRITRTLQTTLAMHPRIDPSLYCISDPSGIQDAVATRQDVLLPSAVLNATVSGLLSRTVNNPNGFHFAASYPEQARDDRSQVFVERIVAQIARLERSSLPPLRLHEVQRPLAQSQLHMWCAQHATDPTNVKAGLGEVSRSLLRRDPRLVVIDPDAHDESEHLVWLANQRNIPVRVEALNGPYRAFSVLD